MTEVKLGQKEGTSSQIPRSVPYTDEYGGIPGLVAMDLSWSGLEIRFIERPETRSGHGSLRLDQVPDLSLVGV